MTALRLPLLLAVAMLAAACSLIGGPRQQPAIYAPAPAITTDPGWPTVAWSLDLAHAGEARLLDGQQILVSPVAGELQVYRAALWARTPAEMVDDVVLRTLEDSGRIPAVARQGSGIATRYRLLLEIRDFRADYAGQAVPAAVIEVNAKLLHQADQTLVDSHSFRQAQPAAGVAVAQVNAAFAQGLGSLGHDIAGWVLQAGQAHERQAHPPAS